MKLCVKRIYCPSCGKLTKCQEKIEGDKQTIVCYRCGNPVFSLERRTWRYIKASAD